MQEQRVTHEFEPLLRVEAADEGNDRLLIVGQQQSAAQGLFVFVYSKLKIGRFVLSPAGGQISFPLPTSAEEKVCACLLAP